MTDDCLPDCMLPDGGQCCRGYDIQRERIEQLEAENADLRRWKALDKPMVCHLRARIEQLQAHKRLQTEDVMNLGASLGQAQVRIEALEKALREIAEWDDNGDQIAGDIARAALAPEQDK